MANPLSRFAALCAAGWSLAVLAAIAAEPMPGEKQADRQAAQPRQASSTWPPAFDKYCLDCHSTAKKKGELDLERFRAGADVSADLQLWRNVVELLEAREMPPKDIEARPSDGEREAMLSWTRSLLHAQILAHAGDPGRVVLRRLSHAEYDNTVRDLTGLDLAPTRDFPADGAAGEGFTNVSDGLVMNSVLLVKYLAAAKQIAAHLVLTPDGFRFSPSKTRRDWTDEAIARLKAAYAETDAGLDGGKPAIERYLRASLVHREALRAGKITPAEVAARENLSAKYFTILWQALDAADAAHSGPPLEALRGHWRRAEPGGADALAAEVHLWQSLLFESHKIGSYQALVWQAPREPTFVASQPAQWAPNIAPGQTEVTLVLATRGTAAQGAGRAAIWRAPRFEGGPHPAIRLIDVAAMVDKYELDYRAHFRETAKYLAAAEALAAAAPAPQPAAAQSSAAAREAAIAKIAESQGLAPLFLTRWVDFLALPAGDQSPSPEMARDVAARIPTDSALGRWRGAALDREQRESRDRAGDLTSLAAQTETLLAGERPKADGSPDRKLYDRLVSLGSPLFAGIDLARWPKAKTDGAKAVAEGAKLNTEGAKPEAGSAPAAMFGLDAARFDADLPCEANAAISIRLPAALFQGRQFMATGEFNGPSDEQTVIQFVAGDRPNQSLPDAGRPVVASPALLVIDADARRRGLEAFRELLPKFLHYPRIVPDDEVICLRLFFREDEPLARLAASPSQMERLDRLWSELRWISQWPLVEQANYDSVYGFVTQEASAKAIKEFESRTREPLNRWAEEFKAELTAHAPAQLRAMAEFASRATRRPFEPKDVDRFTTLYAQLREKNLSHEEAMQLLLAKILVSPAFLYRVEQPGPGGESQPVSAWELASRLSYFLWASGPDEPLRAAAASGALLEPQTLVEQLHRMTHDDRMRGFASEFGAQWLHVRGVRDNHEKNEKLFPTFDDELRAAMLEEAVRFFQDLVQADRSTLNILDADYTFLNERLAQHYGIPDVRGPQWRRVEQVHRWGRGGVLTLGGVLAQQSGASRNSPVLRGNWVVETLLGERIPKPPPNVPRLPEIEGADSLSVREMTERHASLAECAACHQRFDPYGFALEKYDPIGRRREQDATGRPIDTAVVLASGVKFDGLDGLRGYLLSERKARFLEHFCRKLLGYALGRTVMVSDEPLLDKMMAELAAHDYRISAALETIVTSPQFLRHRGLEATKNE